MIYQTLKDLLPLLTTIGALAAIVRHFVVITGKNHEFQSQQLYILSLELASTRKEIAMLAKAIREIRSELAEKKQPKGRKEEPCRQPNWQQA